ncbi:unnamed protein product [Bursaphelenchus xylophilus]|uniref:(pine wood nematode) hypothetical protein n=1 Tax=Bursaphelenchus xylophilus TaxID=6326 RepID=A0A1I7RJ28_BURXY|nr:unnamed protein product [Bursaphelenchus xylophilus]CAD5228657.1 unnamed protein product [Bursaphelenchus xylophilus]CAG9119288.1 unnamed protein product [Bursaphelenchus xylophilus]CAG9119290.1 unnamed protein product [Bursaphelenchus xylophilus]
MTSSDDIAVSYGPQHSYAATIETCFLLFMGPRDGGDGSSAEFFASLCRGGESFFARTFRCVEDFRVSRVVLHNSG